MTRPRQKKNQEPKQSTAVKKVAKYVTIDDCLKNHGKYGWCNNCGLLFFKCCDKKSEL